MQNKHLENIEKELVFNKIDAADWPTAITNLFNYCKELEVRLQKLEDAHIAFGLVIPEMLEYMPGEEDDLNALGELDVDIEDVPLEPIRFPSQEEVTPTEFHLKRKPANDWLLEIVNGYSNGTVSNEELGVLMNTGNLTPSEYIFIIDYNKLRTES